MNHIYGDAQGGCRCRRKLFIAAVEMIFFSLSLNSEILYHEDFSRGLQGWKILTGGRLDTSSIGGVFRVTYADPYLGIVAQTKRRWSDCTYAVDVRALSSSYSNIGIGVGVQSDFSGYYFTIDSAKTFRLIKMQAGSASLLANLPDSRIRAERNRLAIGRRAGEVRFYCNDYVLTSMKLEDPALAEGWVAVAVAGPGCSVEFDNAVISDEFSVGSPTLCLNENFGFGAADRWYCGLADKRAEFSFSGSAGVVVDTRKVSSIHCPLLINGVFAGFSLSAVFSWEDGNDSAAYGLCFAEIVQLPGFSYSYRSLAFLVNGMRHYAVALPDSTSILWSSLPAQSLHGKSGVDTLTVVTKGDRHVFVANGDTLIQARIRDNFAYEAAGMNFAPGMKIHCASFAAAPNASFLCQLQNVAIVRRGRQEKDGAVRFFFDALGRLEYPYLEEPRRRGALLWKWDYGRAEILRIE